jgi:hypothetical protein
LQKRAQNEIDKKECFLIYLFSRIFNISNQNINPVNYVENEKSDWKNQTRSSVKEEIKK